MSTLQPNIFRMDSDDGGPNREQRLLMIAALISILAHMALAMFIRNMTLGTIDPALLEEYRYVVRVHRDDQADLLLEDPSETGQIAVQPNQERSLAELSRTLLMDENAPMSEPAAPTAPDVKLRDLPELRLKDLVAYVAAAAPTVDLPVSVRDRIDPALSVDIKHMQDATGDGSGNAAVSHGEIAAARGMLAEGQPIPGFHPAPKPIGRPEMPERHGFSDRRALNAPLNAPVIDFERLALAGTTSMTVPEHLDNDFEFVLTKHYREIKGGLLDFGKKREIESTGYFRLDITPKRSLRRLQTMPKDVVFLIDTSSSIPQEWVNQMVMGVSDALNSLNEGDRFNIVFFNESPVVFSPESIQPFNSTTLAQAQQFLRDRKSSGYTDVNRAMSRLMVRDVAIDRVYDLILISDGKPTKGVLDTRELINLITRDNDLSASIYCISVGNTQNHELLEFLAYRNKGFCVFTSQLPQAAPAIRDLVSRLRYPIMKDIRTSVIGLRSDEIFPRDLPNIHQGEMFSIFGRFSQEKPFTMQMVGHNGRGLLDFTVTRNIAEAPAGDESVARDWAFWKLHDLYNEMIRQGETPEIKQAIDFLRKTYNLKTLY